MALPIKGNSTRTKASFTTFLILPLSILFLWPNILDSNGIPKLISFSIGSLLMFAITKIKLRYHFILLFPFLLNFTYVISQFSLPNNFDKFLVGSYGRVGGMASSLLLAFIFLHIALGRYELVTSFLRVFSFTYVAILLYGILQYFNFLPFSQTMQFNALSLSMGNPNFASALVGLMISSHIVFLVFDKKARNFFSYSVLLVAFLELYLIKSLQGFLVVIVSLIVTVYMRFIDKIRVMPRQFKWSVIFLILFTMGLILVLTPIGSWIYENGSVRNRLSYWKLSIEIFRDYFWTGVGIDNLRSYVLQYRDLNLTLQEGIFTIPDRSHNVFLDHFVNGGIISGILWLLFVLGITFMILRLIVSSTAKDTYFKCIIILWFGYLAQSAISVDHLALTLIGYISAGFIVSKWLEVNQGSGETKRSNVINVPIKFLSLTLALFATVYSSSYMPSEISASKFYYKGDFQAVDQLNADLKVQSQTLEKVMVKLSQEKQFLLADKLANQLLEMSPNNHQAYYVKSVYLESIGDDIEGKNLMMKAHLADKWNPVYLLSLAIYEYKLGNLKISKDFLNRTEKINPNQQGLDIVRDLLSKAEIN